MKMRTIALLLVGATLACGGYYLYLLDGTTAQTKATHQSRPSNTNTKAGEPANSPGVPPVSVNKVEGRLSTPGASLYSKPLIEEYYGSKSYKVFFEKYSNSPTTSTARFLAEVAFQRCVFVGLLGPEKFLAGKRAKVYASTYSSLEGAQYETSLNTVTSSCADFYGSMSQTQVAEREREFRQLNGDEATAEKLANRIKDKGLINFKEETEPLLAKENSLLISMMGRVWEEAIRKDSGKFENSIFSGISPEVANAAWKLAACEYGHECGRNNEVVLDGCINGAACAADSLREYYQRYAFTPEKYVQLMVTTGKLLDALKQKRLTSLYG